MYKEEIKYLRNRYKVPGPENEEVKAVLKNKKQTYEQFLLECAGDNKTWDEMVFERLHSLYMDLTIRLDTARGEAGSILSALKWRTEYSNKLGAEEAIEIRDWALQLEKACDDVIELTARKLEVKQEMVERKYIDSRSKKFVDDTVKLIAQEVFK